MHRLQAQLYSVLYKDRDRDRSVCCRTKQVKAKTRQLAALHSTVALLRAVLQRLKLTAKLRAALADPAVATSALDLAKVSS